MLSLNKIAAALPALLFLAATSHAKELAAIPLLEFESLEAGHNETNPLVHRNQDIVNGVPVGPNEFKALVFVNVGDGFCTGTLVGRNTVVTAGHCGTGRAASQFQIRVGSHDRTTGGQLVGVSQVFVHPNYKGVGDSDICVLRLNTNIPQSGTVGYAKLPQQGSDPKTTDTAVVAGWGGQMASGGPAPAIAYKTETPFRSRADCQSYYGSSVVTDNVICIGGTGDGKGTCFGDSGGPTLNKVNGNFVGVTSFGPTSGCGTGPSGLTRVGNYVDWINSLKG